ncbi:acyltransferase family protein [Klebsiella aerogenes]|nr:acyltransferase [Klebsiella aerogenes]HED2523606.1 acyltransferase [Klebsiella aerogenes]
MLPQKNWSPELDGLRGYASLWVFLGHICILTQFNIPLLSNPDLGVDLFILLSGYLMAKNYIERRLAEPWESKMTIIRFWMRRFFRIAPLYYFLLLIAFYFGEHFGYYRDVIASAWPVTQTETTRYTDSSFSNFIAHISFAFGFLPYYSFRTVLPDWSIGLEMQYYLLFPFIMLFISRVGFVRASVIVMLLCAIAAFALPGYFSSFPMPSMILFKLPLFLSGMLIYKAVSENKVNYIFWALLAPFVAHLMGYFTSPIRMTLEALIIIAMSLLLMPHKNNFPLKNFFNFVKKLLSMRISQHLGDVSYSVYLLHLMIVIPVVGILIEYTSFESLSPFLRFCIVVFITLPLTYFIANYLFKYIEKNGILLGRTFIKKQKATINNNA